MRILSHIVTRVHVIIRMIHTETDYVTPIVIEFTGAYILTVAYICITYNFHATQLPTRNTVYDSVAYLFLV